MERLQLTSEVTTPLCCSGANQHKAEIRVPSIRGVMRFWFRALMGGILGSAFSDIHTMESYTFGDTAQASAISLRVQERRVARKEEGHSVGRMQPGVIYLGFPLYRWQREKREYTLRRGMIEPGSIWTLTTLLKPQDRYLCDVVMGTLWLTFLFGGLGSRGRRGFGSIKAQSLEYKGAINFRWPQNPDSFLPWALQNLQVLTGLLPNSWTALAIEQSTASSHAIAIKYSTSLHCRAGVRWSWLTPAGPSGTRL